MMACEELLISALRCRPNQASPETPSYCLAAAHCKQKSRIYVCSILHCLPACTQLATAFTVGAPWSIYWYSLAIPSLFHASNP